MSAPNTPLYQTGNGYVHCRDGARLTRESAEINRHYIQDLLSQKGWSDTLMDGWRQDLAALELAMAASFVEQQHKDIA